MRFIIGQHVRVLANGKEGVIGATKEVPFKRNFYEENIFPDEGFDYIIFLRQDDKYEEEMNVYEHELSDIKIPPETETV